jgi:hypothetical protein
VQQLLTPGKMEAGMPFLYASDDAGFAAELMGKYKTDRVAVIDNKDSGRELGLVSAASLLAFYSSQREKEHAYESPNRTRRMLVQGRKLLHKSGWPGTE